MELHNSAIILASILVLGAVGESALATDKKKVRSTVIKVPTTGSIIDVVHSPEFHEWWVKCREGNAIVIYSFDKETKKWGRVVFTPGPPDDKGLKEEAAGKTEKDPTVDDGPSPTEETKKEEPPRSEPEKDPKKDQPPEKRKWWDSLNIFKKSQPPSPPTQRDAAPPDPRRAQPDL
jgi:hypothetical protein